MGGRTRTTWTKGNGPPTAFKPGQSGNPSGGPKTITEIHELAQSYCPAAIHALAAALKDKDRAVPAAIAILDRGLGKPPQALYAHLNGDMSFRGGVDLPPRETLEEWLKRRTHELDAAPETRQPLLEAVAGSGGCNTAAEPDELLAVPSRPGKGQ